MVTMDRKSNVSDESFFGLDLNDAILKRIIIRMITIITRMIIIPAWDPISV